MGTYLNETTKKLATNKGQGQLTPFNIIDDGQKFRVRSDRAYFSLILHSTGGITFNVTKIYLK